MSARSVALLFLASAFASCGESAADAERVFWEHAESFERARALATEQAAASGEYGLRISDANPPGMSEPARELNRLLAGAGVQSVRAERDSASVWHVAFTLQESGLATSGQILSIAHGDEPRGPYNEFSEVRPLGGGWYVSDYVW